MDPQRVRGIAALLLLVAAAAMAEERRGHVRMLVQSSPLAGFRYYEADEAWPDMRVGDRLELAREPDNPHDRAAIRVSWRGRMLGYVPRRENGVLAWAMDRGDALHARISRLSDHPNPARRLQFEVFVE